MGIIKWKCSECGLILKRWTPQCPACGGKIEATPGTAGVTEEELLLAGYKV